MNGQHEASDGVKVIGKQEKLAQDPIPVLLVNGEKVFEDHNDESSQKQELPRHNDHPLKLEISLAGTKTPSNIRSSPNITIPDSTRLQPNDSIQRSTYSIDPDTMSENEVGRRVHDILIDFYGLLKSTENVEDLVKGEMDSMTSESRRRLLIKIALTREETRRRSKEARKRKHERAARARRLEGERTVARGHGGGGESDQGKDDNIASGEQFSANREYVVKYHRQRT
ncbi:MAG: hypothetical protein Q9213_006600 [Squamulea squamosa]